MGRRAVVGRGAAHLHGTFDALIASHVIEHTPDLLGFLDAASTLVSPNGIVILVVPDKRYCFDYFRPLTTTGEVLYAHSAQRSRHTRRIGFDHVAYAVRNGENIAWGQDPVGEIEFLHTLDQAGHMFSTMSEDLLQPYVDMHAWQFTPASFELLMVELARLRETDWRVTQVTAATGCEFYAWLGRGGEASAAALSVSELNARRLALLRLTFSEIRDQIDFLLAHDSPLLQQPLKHELSQWMRHAYLSARLCLAPRDSRRARVSHLTRRALKLLRAEGPILFGRQLGRRVRAARWSLRQ